MNPAVLCITKDKSALTSGLSMFFVKEKAKGVPVYIFDESDHGVWFDSSSDLAKCISYSNALKASLEKIDSDLVLVIHDDVIPTDSTLKKLCDRMKDGVAAVYAVSAHRGYVAYYVEEEPYVKLLHESDRKVVECVCGDDGCVLWNRQDLYECLPANPTAIGRSTAPINFEIGLRLKAKGKKSLVSNIVKVQHYDS